MPEIKLIVSDVDGTLIGKGADTTTPENMRAIERARQKGIGFTLASGRAFQAMAKWRESMRLDAPFICCNGAQVRDGHSVYFNSSFSVDAMRKILSLLDDVGCPAFVYSDVKIYCMEGAMRDDIWEVWRKGGMTEDALRVVGGREQLLRETEGDVQKILGWSPDEPGMNRMLDGARALDGVTYAVNTLGYNAEFMQPGLTKGTALVRLANHCGVGLENILALGDADNDVEMLRAAGVGVAMGDASVAARAAADYVAASCAQSGVAESIERFAL